MKKEVFLAITIGFILGLIITFGIYTANKSLKNLPQLAGRTSPTPATPAAGDTSPTPAPTPVPGAFTLTVSAPVNEALLDKNSTTVTGKTVAGAAVTVLSETSETLAVANSSGDFSVPITLEGGYNRITVTAFDKDGKSSSQSLVVTYTSSKI